VVDPLDGTYNYLRGIPQTCVSIGLMRGRDARLGVIYDFNADECFAARRGGSLLLNGHPLQPVWPENRDHAVLITGFPAGRDYSAESLQRFISDIRRFKKIRMLGSAALAMAYVAAGRADAYYEESINLWDIAAGIALVEAAGGTVQRHPSTRPLAFDTWAVAHATWLKA
jgi:myo-inositol-1(or 4)-monophosphatase